MYKPKTETEVSEEHSFTHPPPEREPMYVRVYLRIVVYIYVPCDGVCTYVCICVCGRVHMCTM